jgi:hypothetical protein
LGREREGDVESLLMTELARMVASVVGSGFVCATCFGGDVAVVMYVEMGPRRVQDYMLMLMVSGFGTKSS